MIPKLALLGYASGIAANNADCGFGPWYLYHHSELFCSLPFPVVWEEIISIVSDQRGLEVIPELQVINAQLAVKVIELLKAKIPFCVVGGDHACAIGTWSGAAHAYREAGDIGLIWIDAHMDSHTPDTSETNNVHGMPVAALLGYGAISLCNLLDKEPKLKPENICLIGVRSYESAEKEFLKQLGVKIFYMDEVGQFGIKNILHQAIQLVTKNTCGFGISIDLDALDPSDAPGVAYRVVDGIRGEDLATALYESELDKKPFLGLEIAEYNPLRDEDQKTAHQIVKLLAAAFS